GSVSSGSATGTQSSWTPDQAGTYTWEATYSGDGNNNAGSTLCGGSFETIAVAAGTVGMITNATPSTGTAGTPGSFSDTATITPPTGGARPTGSVTFNLFDNPGCNGTALITGTGTIPTTGAIQASSGNLSFTPS